VKILFVSSWYPNRVQPRLGNFIQRHAEAVAVKEQVASLFVTSDESCKEQFELEEEIIRNVFTVNVYYKKVRHSFPLVSQLQKALRYRQAYTIGLKRIREYSGNIDVVHQNVLYPAGAIALMLKYFSDIPYLITEHSTEYHIRQKSSFFTKWLKKKIAASASFICPVSENLKQTMLKYGLEGNYEIVNNVVNQSVFFPPQEKMNRSKIIFLHISTLDDRQKNISGLLRVIQKLSTIEKDFELQIVGDEEYTHHLQYAQTLGILNKTVFFQGTKTLNEVAESMRNSDCFVMFSNYENFPCVIAEALTCGLSVISSDVGGIGEHINESNGILVQAADEPGLLNAFMVMIKNLKERKYHMNEISRQAQDQFSYESVSEKFISLYLRALKK
jgi:L-malate glycosyltransferase